MIIVPEIRPTEAPGDPPNDHDKPSLAFRDLLQKDPTVCQNCFQRTHDAVAFDRYSGVYGWHTIEYWYGRRDRTTPAHHDRMTYGLTSACTCGTIGYGKRRPIDYKTACEYGENILQTLREKHVAVNPDRFRGEIRDRKRDPNAQGREDSHVFQPAVEAGIRTAQDTTPTP